MRNRIAANSRTIGMDYPDFSKEREKIARMLKLISSEKIEEAFQYFKQLYLTEENRRDALESRANMLIAAAAIMMAFVTGFLCMILYEIRSISLLFLIIILIEYIIITLFLIKTIEYAIEISKLGKFIITSPKKLEDYSLKDPDIGNIRISRVIDYYYLFANNKDINDKKEACLNSAQNRIKNAVIVLLFLTLTFAIDIALSKKVYIKYLF